MKRLLFVILITFLLFCTAEAQLMMDCDGDVRLGTHTVDPTYKLDVRGSMSITCTPGANSGLFLKADGSYPAIVPQWNYAARLGLWSYKFYYLYTNWVYYDNLYDFSDLAMKENIRIIESPLSSILKINGIKYDRKREFYENTMEEDKEKAIESGKNKYGVIAQELMEIYPDLVTFNEEAQLYAVNYVGLIPILVEAIKEQQTQIEALQIAISGSKKSAAVATSSQDPQLSDLSSSTLYQNSPNPFHKSTEIFFSLSEGTQNAAINIYNMSGTQLKSIELFQRGKGSILINGSELDAGMYMYAMIADGRVIATKQMILTD